MAVGGRTSLIAHPVHDHHAPHMKPPFTLGTLKKAIPPHCFNRSLPRSLLYLLKDLCLALALFRVATVYFPVLHPALRLVTWPAYWALQSITFTGVWVIAHECGHHAFSNYQWVDDAVGLVLHSFLFVPYFSWKYSHRRHHSNTGSLERDEVFVPKPRSHLPRYWRYLNNPPGRALFLFVSLTMGWPLYLAFNVSGRDYARLASHYDPHGPIYSGRERLQIYISDMGIIGTAYVVYRVAIERGVVWVMGMYGLPLAITNAFLVTITYLQHTHKQLPHYDSTEWEWLRGALSTVDRDFGTILNKAFHNITDTHIAHHLFSMMPHYHAEEATRALKPVLGNYYRFDATPVWEALWREAKECVYVEADATDKGVFWYTNRL